MCRIGRVAFLAFVRSKRFGGAADWLPAVCPIRSEAQRGNQPASQFQLSEKHVTLPYAMSATAMTIGSETTDAMDVTVVNVLKVPCVDNPSSDLNIQKKLLLT
jgi:hypothetical protein